MRTAIALLLAGFAHAQSSSTASASATGAAASSSSVNSASGAASASSSASSNASASGSASSSGSFSPTPVSTSVPMPTLPLNDSVPGQGVYPPLQYWCNQGANETYCPSLLLQDVELSGIYADSKTFVDKPTVGTLNQTLAAFANFTGTGNVTIQEIEAFVNASFKGEGLELSQIPLEGFNATPAIVTNVKDPIYKGWISVVNSYWQLLIRQTNETALCQPGTCESSLIPLNHTIVVPGGRYREIYYWDSRWILEGLLQSELYTYAWDLMQNFMDFIDVYGFIPNGGRKYYLNRSQPPVFVSMLDAYVSFTGNLSILERALPLAEQELQWWSNNRSINVTSPYSGTTWKVYHYNVSNTAPRPEGYVEDWTTAFGASPALNETERGELYSELATGAETGWDYSARWCKQPVINVSDNNPALRTLNTRAIIPVDLNSLLSGDHKLLAYLYEVYANSTNSTNYGAQNNISQKVSYHKQIAQDLSYAVLDLHWDPARYWFYDFNLTSNNRSDLYTPAATFALWQNITPPALMNNETAALQTVSGIRYLLGRYTGIPSVATLLTTGLNWDFPNSWPLHVYTSVKAFQQLGRVNPNATVLTNTTLAFANVTANQLGMNETALPPQPQSTIGNVSLEVAEASGKPWPQALAIEYANRYMQAAFCTWYSTGGKIDGLLTQLPLSDLNATGTYTADQTGVMFEKFNVTDTDAAGGGGEYTVQIGFGWTNGVAGEYGQFLPQPTCPLIPIIEIQGGTNTSIYQNGSEVPYNATGNGTAGNSTSTPVMFAGFRLPCD